MNAGFGRLLLFVVLAAVLAACGTDRQAGRVEMEPVTGVTAMDGAVRICLDVRRDFTCDDSNPGSAVDGRGSWAFTAEKTFLTADAVLLLELEDGSTSSAVLARPLSWEQDFSAFSSLLTVEMSSYGAYDAAAAMRQLEAHLRFEGSEDLESIWADNEAVVLQAARELFGKYRAAGRSSSPKPSARQLWNALRLAIPPYLDGDSGKLLRLVTPGTLTSHAAQHAGTGELCSLPDAVQLLIRTDSGAMVVEKRTYLDASLWFASLGTDFAQGEEIRTRVRGRGNSTWRGEKKPYRLKLDAAAELLGMTGSRNWALLANHFDKTMLRNALGFCIAETLGMPHTPESRFLELTMNEEYLGLYQLTNKTYEVQNLAETLPPVADDMARFGIEDSFVLEIDARLNPEKDDGFRSSVLEIPYKFRTDTDSSQIRRVGSWFDGLEVLVADGDNPERLSEVAALVDLSSLVDLYVAHEFMRNADGFWSSTYLYRLPGEPVSFGPVWDFDLAAGNYRNYEAPEGWTTRTRRGARYIQQLLDEPDFEKFLRARFIFLAEQAPELAGFLEAMATTVLADPLQRNFERWAILDEKASGLEQEPAGSYEAEISRLKHWVLGRADWIVGQFH